MVTKVLMTVMEARRRDLGLTQLDLAIKVGVTQAVISQYERGYLQGIRGDTIDKIAAVLKVEDAQDLLKDYVEYTMRQKDLGL